jgi:hypothetical protein
VLHMLELNAIRLALKRAGILVDWKHTLQIVSENLVDCGNTTKDTTRLSSSPMKVGGYGLQLNLSGPLNPQRAIAKL